MRISQFLADCRVHFETVLHPPAYTAQKRARFLGVSGRQVVKCVLLTGPHGPFLAVLRATDHIDLNVLSRWCGGPVRLADVDEIADRFTDCERGALIPFGSLYDLRTVLEDGIDPETLIVFEAQFHAVAIRMRCADFEQLERPMRLRFARPKISLEPSQQ